MMNWWLLRSSIGKKALSALTGFGLVLYVILHLLGNLTLFKQDGGAAFNRYAEALASYGWLITIAEIALLLAILLHVGIAIRLHWENRRARPTSYYVKPRGKLAGITRTTVSSLTMHLSGLVLLVFLIVHIWQFRFGPGLQQGYRLRLNDETEIRNLYRLVFETFRSPWMVAFYCLSMIPLWSHLRHGMWSGFLSLGLLPGRIINSCHRAAGILAMILAFGFFGIPIWVCFFGSAGR